MADLMKWQPFSSLMREFFEDVSPFFGRSSTVFRDDIDFLPKLDIKNTEKEFMVIVDLPGVEKKDLEVSLEDGILTIKGQKKGEKREEANGYTYFERTMGSFERRIRVPENVEGDKLKAEFKDGVLNLTAPKVKELKPATRKIEIK